jgi:hypothetical protein
MSKRKCGLCGKNRFNIFYYGKERKICGGCIATIVDAHSPVFPIARALEGIIELIEQKRQEDLLKSLGWTDG